MEIGENTALVGYDSGAKVFDLNNNSIWFDMFAKSFLTSGFARRETRQRTDQDLQVNRPWAMRAIPI